MVWRTAETKLGKGNFPYLSISQEFIGRSSTISVSVNHTVDARNPAPPWMVETLEIMGSTIYQLVQDVFHPQYVALQLLHVALANCYSLHV